MQPPDFPRRQYRAVCTRVIDGDTYVFDVDLGFNVSKRVFVRLRGVDTPELRSSDENERARAQDARAFVTSLIYGRWVLLEADKGKSFDRWIGDVLFQPDEGGWRQLSEAILKAGHGAPYYG